MKLIVETNNPDAIDYLLTLDGLDGISVEAEAPDESRST